jgi:hypothetical protein
MRSIASCALAAALLLLAAVACSKGGSSTKVSGIAPKGFEQFTPGISIEDAVKLAQGDPELASATWTLGAGDRVAADFAAAVPAIKDRLKEADDSTSLTISPAKQFPEMEISFDPVAVRKVQVIVSRDESALAELLKSAKAKYGDKYTYVDAIKKYPVMAPLFSASDEYTWVLCEKDIEYTVRWISPKIPQAKKQASVEWRTPDAKACGKVAKK